MKKVSQTRANREMFEENDFSKRVRGQYFKGYATGTNSGALAPDVAKVFPDSRLVKDFLRLFIKAARQQLEGAGNA